MTQKQLDIANFRLKYDDFETVERKANRVVCRISENFTIVVLQKHSGEVNIVIRNGKKCLKLSEAMFGAICNAQLSVDYIKGLLRDTE
jgi:hypothetical protein